MKQQPTAQPTRQGENSPHADLRTAPGGRGEKTEEERETQTSFTSLTDSEERTRPIPPSLFPNFYLNALSVASEKPSLI